jgi:uncharacterized protein YndB with AHSA1/START domain
MAKQTTPTQHIVGQTKDAGYQIGARRTFDVSPQRAWEVITSGAGRKLWLGDAPEFRLEPGATYHTASGAEGKIGVVSLGGHFRMTWQPGSWPRPSTIQVRVIPSGAKAVISFHQDNLPGPKERRERQAFYAGVLDALEEALKPG